jgi:S-adenosylmethionine:tRNA-ribosyltransferase-isomerase (queuine synthetase)
MRLAIAGDEQGQNAYQQAVQHNYLWHEVGDLHLIPP